MDRKDRECEMVSVLLPQLTPKVISGGWAGGEQLGSTAAAGQYGVVQAAKVISVGGWGSGECAISRPTQFTARLAAPRPPPASLSAADQVALGFTRLLAGLDDLALDIPGAARLLELFLGEHTLD